MNCWGLPHQKKQSKVIEMRDQLTLTTAAPPSQRWKLGRNYWRVDRDEGFRKADYAIDVISNSVAREFVNTHHYSHSYPFAIERIGLFRGRELVGVCVFSFPINNAVIPRYTGLPAEAGTELGRFILLDEVPYNAESFFLAGALKALSSLRPDISSVVAYSDPMPRTTEDGQIVLPGHIGIAYQASNARYLGRASGKTLYLTRNGVALSSRGISKIRLQEHGAQSAEKRLVSLGAEPRQFGQDPSEWIDNILAGNTFQKIRHPGNHIYAWPIGNARRKNEISKSFSPTLNFPKSMDALQTELGLA